MTKLTFAVLSAYLSIAACGENGGESGVADGGSTDGGVADSGSTDGGSTDGGSTDGGSTDGGSTDGGAVGERGFTFFVTSTGNGAAAGDYGGLTGADARCQELAVAVGQGDRTWRAYLSTSAEGPGQVVHARDRIGAGPWLNVEDTLVANDLEALHTAGIPPSLMLDENGDSIPSNEHDLLTGSGSDGRLRTRVNNQMATCANWTSSSSNDWGWVGHADDQAWNNAHDTRCSEVSMGFNNGTGRLMCFAQ